MTWNFDVEAMPRGHWTETERKVGNAVKTVLVFHPAWLWLATDKNDVFRGHWTEKGDRIAGATKETRIVAWQHFVRPIHPNLLEASQ